MKIISGLAGILGGRFRLRLRRGALAWCAVVILGVPGFLAAKDALPVPQSNPPPNVEAWAMLFQMMDRLRSDVMNNELTLIHFEDPVASAAVSSLLTQLSTTTTPDAPAKKIAWTIFVRDISALHTAADAAQPEACLQLIRRVEDEFQRLQADSNPAMLESAHRYAERYTCPMHSDVIGVKGELCGKCGMPLDQLVVLLPSDEAGSISVQHVVRATITTDMPLEVGKSAHATLHLRRSENEPITLADLIETHTRKIHLLIVDGSLRDYHHEHPQPTDTPGDYAFDFTPGKPGSYLAWADLRPKPLGLQEYEKAIITGKCASGPVTDREPRYAAEADGLQFQLTFSPSVIKVGEPSSAVLTVTRADGSGFDELEPVMAAFAHLVGFNEDKETVLHMHPIGAPITDNKMRGGPDLRFKIYATKPGFVRLFAQVQVKNRPIFVSFNLRVIP